MRPQSKRIVNVRGTELGGPSVPVCLPLVATNRSDLLQQADQLARMKPDLLEWRIDSFASVGNRTDSLSALDEIRNIIGPLPLIFTCRIHSEGGAQELGPEDRLELIEGAIGTGLVDIVDIELCNTPQFIDAVKQAVQRADVALLLSYHDFKKTPDEDFICDTLVRAQAAGADIAKMAVMPRSPEDVLTLMSATLTARRQSVEIPIVTMSMGEVGGITRIAGGLFGSDMTFAKGLDASAPGQIPIERLRVAMDLIYNA